MELKDLLKETSKNYVDCCDLTNEIAENFSISEIFDCDFFVFSEDGKRIFCPGCECQEFVVKN